MSDATQKSDGAIGTTNPIFDVVILPRDNCILKLWPDSSFVFGKNRTVLAIEWNRTLARIEAVETSVFVRVVEYLPCDQIARPTASVSQALRFREVRLLPPQL